MNGKCAKRIRFAALKQREARPSKRGETFRQTVQRLKQEYRGSPYHLRSTPVKAGHSEILRKQLHGGHI